MAKATTRIVTLGPATYPPEILRKISPADVAFVRINLSHTPKELLRSQISHILDHTNIPLIVDTEGCQIRTGDFGDKPIELVAGHTVRVHSDHVVADSKDLYIRPAQLFEHLSVGDLIFVDFDTVILRVDDVTPFEEEGYVICSIITGGIARSNKLQRWCNRYHNPSNGKGKQNRPIVGGDIDGKYEYKSSGYQCPIRRRNRSEFHHGD